MTDHTAPAAIGTQRPAGDPPTVQQDARGIVDLTGLQRWVRLHRHPAGEALAGLVAWFWSVTWAVPPGRRHRQQVLTHPGANLYVGSVEPAGARVEAMVEGVQQRLSSRELAGTGWTVAALTAPGGLAALTDSPARLVTNRTVPWDALVRRPHVRPVAPSLVRDCAHEDAEQARVEVLRATMVRAVDAAAPARVAAARATAELAARAEQDPSLRRAEDLAALAGVTLRTLQRQFAEHVGVSPAWLLRRYRLLQASEQARCGEVDWAGLAVDLGYADQAHLVRDFRHHLGTTPAAYARRLAGAGGR